MKLASAGALTIVAAMVTTSHHGWVIAIVGGIMVAAGIMNHRAQVAAAEILKHQDEAPTSAPLDLRGRREVITRERIRVRRERHWPAA